MMDIVDSSSESPGFLEHDCRYSGDDRDVEDLFIKATLEDKPLILRRYSRGGLGNIPATQYVPAFLKHQIRNKNPSVLCHILGKKSCELETTEVLQKFRVPRHKRKEIVNILGYPFVHDLMLLQHVTALRFIQDNDLLRPVSCTGVDQNELRTKPQVAAKCGFIVCSMPQSFTGLHLDEFSTAVATNGTKLWMFFPNTPKNMSARVTWKESDGFGAFEGCSAIFLDEGDVFILPCGYHHAVYTVEDLKDGDEDEDESYEDEDESNKDALMIGYHYILAETAARNLEMMLLMLEWDGLTNDPPEEAMKYLQKLVGVITF
jgi:hypothetical protein